MTRRRGSTRQAPPPTREASRTLSLARLRIGLLLIVMVVSVFAARLFQLQSLDAAEYAQRARAVGAVEEILPATRGAITDRFGAPLAESLDGKMIVADPTKTTQDAAAIATVLSEELGVDYIAAVRNLTWPGTRFRFVARRIPATEADATLATLKALGYRGLDVRSDPIRSYPNRDIGANLVGRVNDDGEGADGAELLFDERLRGTDGSTVYDKATGGQRIPLGDNSTIPAADGKDVAMTIDTDAQFFAQRLLRDTVEGALADSGFIVVMDTATGQVLALADYPTYDASADVPLDPEALGSAALREVYEPGSVQKVLTAAAVLDAGVARPGSRFKVPDSMPSSNRSVSDYFRHDVLNLTLTGSLAKSSNVGMAKVARRLDPAEMSAYLRSFGLGSRTGLEGYIESAGILAPPEAWSQLTADNIAYGQGVAVNGVQMAAALNAIANDGVYVQPSLLLGQAPTQFGVVGSDRSERRRVISKVAARQTAQMMEMVTTRGAGTAPKAAIPGYRTAGKTGTAQVPIPGGYSEDEFVVSFGGFAPADDPRFTVYVVVKNNRTGLGGGATAGPPFRAMMTYLLQHYAVPPTQTTPPALPTEWSPMGTRPRSERPGVVSAARPAHRVPSDFGRVPE